MLRIVNYTADRSVDIGVCDTADQKRTNNDESGPAIHWVSNAKSSRSGRHGVVGVIEAELAALTHDLVSKTGVKATCALLDAQLQLSQLRWVTSSRAGAAGLAENYAGLPIGF